MEALGAALLAPGAAASLPFPASAFPVLLICNLGGLIRIIYAFGLGYGLCMLASGVLTFSQAPTSPYSYAGCGLYGAYGLRLVVYLLRRQCSEAYNTSEHGKTLNEKMDQTKFWIKIMVVVFVSLTQLACAYSLQPIAFAGPGAFDIPFWTSFGVGVFGLLLESVADEQKLAAKKVNPNAPIMSGCFRIVRHPNYTGEILFWLGVFGAGQAAIPTASWGDRLATALGPVMFFAIMTNAAKGLDKKAKEKYAELQGYSEYVSNTASLWPCFKQR